MLFNSYEFLFFFLPIVFGIYFWLHRLQKSGLAKGWLVLASLVFYAWWKIAYLPIILISIVCNFLLGLCLAHVSSPISKKLLLILSVGLNLAALGYFKYTHFLLSSANAFLGFHVALPDIILPLGISFFTFTQTAYLVDTYKGKVKDVSFLNYALFVTFFPHLIAGPILHHQEMMPQFEDRKKYKIDGKQLCTGIFLFVVGLVKKVLIADQFAKCANLGFDVSSSLGFWEAWVTSLCYTFQLYFDFSGYTDMALGIALLFNIHLPQNFNSPYKAQNLQDFWRRWHITLSRFLRDYIYIPLGGNRLGEVQTCLNLLITFLIGGIWHGAG